MLVMGIETSCDDTAISVYDNVDGLLSNNVYSQKIHKKYKGIVPELAARQHLKKIIPLIKKTLIFSQKKINEIDLIAYTAGPGLVSSLIIGATMAHTLGFSLNIPVIPINHIEGHLLSIMLEKKKLNFPFIVLVVSGGNTQLIYVYDFEKYKILGYSIDDAAGEALDKIAIMLGLNFPGGKNLSKIAQFGVSKRFIFPRPMTKNKNNLNFSFSGLKTFTKNFINKYNFLDFQTKADIACAFEDAIIDTLFIKSLWALEKYKIKKLVISGGVSSNKKLRLYLIKKLKKNKIQIFYNTTKLCTDNAAMIAYVGIKKFHKKNNCVPYDIIIDSKLKLNFNK
ncbi:tRNA (adenosine(37)-N6)-threonylcarbamoyltransferase complex transferase subunit TsaD [Enterobacteriaceae endosymbiont of Plateumaris consimilis]|uniref:tRNA (adenosine(37)-N6)-threonylcarbamoyltransferase complex transferase subunit TsaD n=1 Tax=Enterobacteriaceae endosymbiont of Plateumaris consimilis TaxID=2675794 RepID=UPI0014494E49|nr:tRNA (adenosine(37)-N6)-threonylcarbamoyltransferase complex transferase subunit TsaD [Enterobacteriaceae endosymbiont of Plateumaris consimilis]QJC28650.1 tRNA (adenosine(37)-N6)-threonylcarbamoyltransferase complex transferase subunit TsaD [Enterobacteriaceae endosymbiont of Plateumaris consimilis]